jgi:hypothetical protein
VFILKVVKVVCFDTLLQVLILKVVRAAVVSVFERAFARQIPCPRITLRPDSRTRAGAEDAEPTQRRVCIVADSKSEACVHTPTPGVLGKEAASC